MQRGGDRIWSYENGFQREPTLKNSTGATRTLWKCLRNIGTYAPDAKTNWIHPTMDAYGGIGAIVPSTGLPPRVIMTAYMWLPNYQVSLGVAPQYQFTAYNGDIVDTRPWPTKGSECKSDTPIITHRVSYDGDYFWDLGHSGTTLVNGSGLLYEDISDTEGQPIGYGDGHVEYRNKSDIKPRARHGGNEYYY